MNVMEKKDGDTLMEVKTENSFAHVDNGFFCYSSFWFAQVADAGQDYDLKTTAELEFALMFWLFI